MTRDLTLEGQVQVLLNELGEQLIPFPLSVGKINKKEGDEFTVHFYDIRIRTAKVVLAKGQSFRDAVRVAVLSRVSKMSGPLR